MPSAVYRSSVCFNPRTHMGCDGCWLIIAFCGHRRFNPRTHMGCASIYISSFSFCFVSIHAPTWGATIPLLYNNLNFEVSIHAPTWGATSLVSKWISIHVFQSTHPHGVRPVANKQRMIISCFNPRTHMGCDGVYFYTKFHFAQFQSTHPHGVRLYFVRDRARTDEV